MARAEYAREISDRAHGFGQEPFASVGCRRRKHGHQAAVAGVKAGLAVPAAQRKRLAAGECQLVACCGQGRALSRQRLASGGSDRVFDAELAGLWL